MGVYRIVKGVGRGLPHAGDIADLIRQEIVEVPWPPSMAIWRRCCINGYFRFRDDMIIVAAHDLTHTGVQMYLDGIISRAGAVGYAVQVEYADTQVHFLNVTVKVDVERRHYST